MPNYDYVCAACGGAVEIFQPMSEAPKKKCPACGKPKLERRIGAGAGFLFKGGGFHRTDYRSSSYKAAEKADSAGGSGSTDSSAKPEAAESKGNAKDAAKGDAASSSSKGSESGKVDAPKSDARSPKSDPKKKKGA